ncbi:hypothetical protein CFHF_11640 [Caulobacter flavus]|uniref:TonB C-terminal domain-containing protein n=1 Tax=Caulobacter flavus TaxID=1679497 RepID=A0A2N5CTV4_9CAUL|nr:energy transducer TonB [Caulobacter flavus]AYV45811.1 hypothetical protein C1707_05840 [Caulobacter flavus]PLR15745.1 hypothetical protein CFHF_11640 [Caulobacter flavus]
MSGDEQTGTTTYKPDWQRKPTADQMARYYPERAQREEIGGSATILCKVGDKGRLTDCQATREAPEGYGFGKAAVRLSAEFEMTPPPPELVGKKDVTIPITFSVPPSPPPFELPATPAQLGLVILTGLILLGGLLGLTHILRVDRQVDI